MKKNLAEIDGISVVTPCYNEEEGMALLFSRLNSLEQMLICEEIEYEIILVDDGSVDRTRELAEQALVDHEHYQLVCHERNQGIGAALRTGFRTASKHIVVTVDADTNYDVRDVPLLLEYFNSGADLVTGSIFAPGAEWNYPAHRFVLSRSLVELYRRALKGKGDNIYTFTCGFRAYEREKLLECLPEADDFVATAEILIRFLLKGFSVVEYPCFNYDRKYGVSKLRTLSTIKSHLEFMKKVYLGQVG